MTHEERLKQANEVRQGIEDDVDDIGDCTPNMGKVDAFLALYSNEQKTIDRLSGMDLFAQHLRERSEEVRTSRGKNWGIRIAEVEPFSSLRFPRARHL